jgi:hypothetical protein
MTMIKQKLMNIFDRLTMEIFGHSYRFLKAQRLMLRRLEAETRLKDRLAASVVLRLRRDLQAPDSEGW